MEQMTTWRIEIRSYLTGMLVCVALELVSWCLFLQFGQVKASWVHQLLWWDTIMVVENHKPRLSRTVNRAINSWNLQVELGVCLLARHSSRKQAISVAGAAWADVWRQRGKEWMVKEWKFREREKDREKKDEKGLYLHVIYSKSWQVPKSARGALSIVPLFFVRQ